MSIVPAADGRYLRELLGKPFTDEQLAIVTADLQPQLVIAGAGSGKTTVMAARVVHAVAWHRYGPDGILGLTFTNKAASELAERVRLALAQLARLDGDGEPATGRGCTSRSRRPADRVDLPRLRRVAHQGPRPADRPRARLAAADRGRAVAAGAAGRTRGAGPVHDVDVDPALRRRAAARARRRPCPSTSSAPSRCAPSTASMIEDVAALHQAHQGFAAIKETARDPGRAARPGRALPRSASATSTWSTSATRSRWRPRSPGRCPEVGAAERERFPVVFLDEYQDTGVAQRVLLAHLFDGGHPVTAVGDPCQSIYGWRGASIGNLLRFFEHFPSEAPAARSALPADQLSQRWPHPRRRQPALRRAAGRPADAAPSPRAGAVADARPRRAGPGAHRAAQHRRRRGRLVGRPARRGARGWRAGRRDRRALPAPQRLCG